MLALPLLSDLVQRVDVQHIRLVCKEGEGLGFRKGQGSSQTHPSGSSQMANETRSERTRLHEL